MDNTWLDIPGSPYYTPDYAEGYIQLTVEQIESKMKQCEAEPNPFDAPIMMRKAG